MERVSRLDAWFSTELKQLKCSIEARAYVIGVLASPAVSGQSIISMFYDAQTRGDFVGFQRTGDEALWYGAFGSTEDLVVVENFGRLAYYACHRILRGQWKIYEELADTLPNIANSIRTRYNLTEGRKA